MSKAGNLTNTVRAVSKRPFRVSIEGNIGSGKSTCIKYFDKFRNVEKHGASQPSHPGITVKMFERSVQNSRHCFVENAKKQNFLQEPEYQVLLKWFDYTEKSLDISLDLIVYLKTTPQIVWDRMMKRGRSEESEVPLEYLQQVHDSYEKWINSPDIGCEVLTIDADRDLDCVKEDLERYAYKILGGNHTN
ncbi:Deoxynucleoside kinase [Papilio xuthus]|uniref:Deoxynucleoside kinase n=1 Tax=Papilio xuthus TaxID=66420 RepID=A0A194PIL6_PAPXU|nr:Deoxynucleoside kinase [Papilio xuthus]